MGLIIFVILLVILAVYTVAYCLRIVPQSEAYVVERFGSYSRTLGNGMHLLVPFADRIANKVSLKEMVLDFDPQSVITKDNVTMQIDTVVYMQIVDPSLFTYGASDPILATENLTATTLRNIIGNMDLDETLTSRDTINQQMRIVIDDATDSWGIKVMRIELKNIIPPQDIRNAMEKQMRAEREKREKILMAEGEREAMITRSEGLKASKLLEAQAEKEANILSAEGQAESIKIIYDAQVHGIKAVKEAEADDRYIQLESLKTLAKVADGQATKIIVPSNLQDLTSLLTVSKEMIQKEPDNGRVRRDEIRK